MAGQEILHLFMNLGGYYRVYNSRPEDQCINL